MISAVTSGTPSGIASSSRQGGSKYCLRICPSIVLNRSVSRGGSKPDLLAVTGASLLDCAVTVVTSASLAFLPWNGCSEGGFYDTGRCTNSCDER